VESIATKNPYPPTTQSVDRRTYPVLPLIGLAIGSILLLGFTLSSLTIVYLYVRYPGLYDPSSQPVTYWPEIGAMVNALIALLTGMIGTPVLWKSIVALPRKGNRIQPIHGKFENCLRAEE
jgi:hypothetical protein